MINQVAELTWQAANDMPVSMIPKFVETIAKNGGSFLIYGNTYLDVQSAKENKDFVKQYMEIAKSHYAKSLTSDNEGDAKLFYWKTTEALYQAGFYYRHYINDIRTDCPEFFKSEISEFIGSYPELKIFWDRGVSNRW